MSKNSPVTISYLQKQKKQFNEELDKFYSILSRLFQEANNNSKSEKMVKDILETYQYKMIQLKGHNVSTQLDYLFNICDFIDLSKYNDEIKEHSKNNHFIDMYRFVHIELKEKILSDIKELTNTILELLNNLDCEYTFYLISTKITELNYNYSPYYRLHGTAMISIDIM